MPPIRQELEITANDAQVKKAGQTIKQAFDPRTIRDFRSATVDMERQLTKVTRTQLDLNKALAGVEKGSKAYKDLAKQLKTVEREATSAGRALTQIDRLMQRAQRQQQQGQQRRQGFGAGLAQGAGVGQYIPTGTGMKSRIGGMMLGGMGRRLGGMAAAPFQMPGIGGVSQMLSGIPVIGGVLGGALQQASGVYQQAVGFDRGQIGNIQHAGTQGGIGGIGGRRNAARRKFNARQGRSHAEAVKAAPTGKELSRHIASVRRGDLPSGFDAEDIAAAGLSGKRQPGVFEAGTETTAKIAKSQFELSDHAEEKKAASASKKKIAKARASAMAKVVGRVALPGPGFGVDFGLAPQQTQQAFGQFRQAQGGAYTKSTRGQFKEALAAQVGFGVTAQQSGQFARMGGAGGGGAGMMGLATVLQSAVAQGLQGSQITEFLGTLVSLGQKAEKMGVKFNVQDFVRTSAQLAGSGIKGVQAQRIAGGLQGAAQGVSQRGVQSPTDVLLARAAGFDPGQGPEGYAKAMNKMSGGMSQDMLTNLLGQLTTGVKGAGFGPEMQALMLRRAMGKMGVQIGPGQASSIISSYAGGNVPNVGDVVTKGARRGARARMISGAKGAVGAAAPTAGAAAALDARRVHLGRQVASFIVPMEHAALDTTMVIKNFGTDINKLTGWVRGAIKALDKLTKGGIAGLIEKVIAAYLKGLGIKHLF